MTDEIKPFYNKTQRTVLVAHFGEESLPLLDAAARLVSDLDRLPIGTVEQCDTHACKATRVRMLDNDGELDWTYTLPLDDGSREDFCAGRSGKALVAQDHAWRRLKPPSPF